MLNKWRLLPLALLAALSIVSLSGCFQNPTNPFVNAFGGCTDGCTNDYTDDYTDGGGSGIYPTPTPVSGGTGTGAITGTISGSNGEFVTVYSVNVNTYAYMTTSRTGDGTYTISGLAAGTYSVSAESSNYEGAYMGYVTVTGGNTTSGINITMQPY